MTATATRPGPADAPEIEDVLALCDRDRHPNLRGGFFSRGIARPGQIVPSRVEVA